MTLKKDGTAKRTYTATGLGKGKYSFRVRAYRTRLVTIPTKAIAYSSTNIDGLKTNASHNFDRSLLEKINYPEDILNGAYSEWWLRSAGDTYRYGIVYVKTHGKISAWSSYVGLFKEKGIRPVIEVSKKILR